MNGMLRFGTLASVLHVNILCTAADSLRFEAEDCVVNRDAMVKDAFPPDKWTLWSTDRDAHKKWSGGMVLKSPVVKEDRTTPDDGAPPLRLVPKNIPKGTYDVVVKHGKHGKGGTDPYISFWKRATDTCKIDAYRLGVTTVSMGYSTRAMLSYCPAATAPNVNVTFVDEAAEPCCRNVFSVRILPGSPSCTVWADAVQVEEGAEPTAFEE